MREVVKVDWIEIANRAFVRHSKEVCVARSSSEVWNEVGGLIDYDYGVYLYAVECVLHGTSTPGHPYTAMGYNTNEQLFSNIPLLVYEHSREIFEFLLGTEDIRNAFDHGICLRLFGKTEDLTREKVAKKGCRLICNVTVALLIVEIVVYFEYHKAAQGNYGNRPQQPGMGLHDDGLRMLNERFCRLKTIAEQNGKKLISSDMSNFDWTVYLDLQFGKVEYVRLNLGYSLDSDWYRVARRLEEVYSTLNFVLPDGRVMRRVEEGTSKRNGAIIKNVLLWNRIQVTGRDDTAPGNSISRSLQDELVGAYGETTMGDDDVAIFRDEQSYYDALQSYNFDVKIEELPEGAIASFCSHLFFPDILAYPQDPHKLVYSALGKPPCPEQYGSIMFNIRNHPLRKELQEDIIRSGWFEACFTYDGGS
jgi:hypothetical protein